MFVKKLVEKASKKVNANLSLICCFRVWNQNHTNKIFLIIFILGRIKVEKKCEWHIRNFLQNVQREVDLLSICIDVNFFFPMFWWFVRLLVDSDLQSNDLLQPVQLESINGELIIILIYLWTWGSTLDQIVLEIYENHFFILEKQIKVPGFGASFQGLNLQIEKIRFLLWIFDKHTHGVFVCFWWDRWELFQDYLK